MLRTQISVTSRQQQQQQQQPSSPCPLQQMMWFLLFQHRLSPHHAVSPSGNLHTQYQPPPESAAHGIGKPRHWSKTAEPTTFTLTLTHSQLHSHCLHYHVLSHMHLHFCAYNSTCPWSAQAATSHPPSVL